VDLASRTFDVEILVPNDKHELKTGNFAKASILTREDPAAMTVPTESLVTFAGVTKVFVVENGKSHGVEVATGMAGNGWYEIAGPLTVGQRVVTSGYTQLADGTLVRE